MKKNHLGMVLGAAAVIAAGTLLFHRTKTGFAWSEFLAVLERLRWSWLISAIVLIQTTYLVRSLRWGVILRPVAERVSLAKLFSATCIGFTAVVLFGRAGEPVRPYLIARQHGVPFSTQVAAWVVERMLDLLMILVIFGAALTQVDSSGLQPGPKVGLVMEVGGWVAGLTGALCLIVLAGLRKFRGRVQQRLLDALAFLPEAARLRIDRFFTAFDQGMQATRERSGMWALVGYTVFDWILLAAAFLCVFRSFPTLAGFRLVDALIALGFISFGSAVQLPGVGGGIQVATMLVLTELYGVPLEPASGVALVMWVANFLTVVPLGLALGFHEGIKWRNMSHVGDESPDLGAPGFKL